MIKIDKTLYSYSSENKIPCFTRKKNQRMGYLDVFILTSYFLKKKELFE